MERSSCRVLQYLKPSFKLLILCFVDLMSIQLACLARIEPPQSWQRIVPVLTAKNEVSTSTTSPPEFCLEDLCNLIERNADKLEADATDVIQYSQE